MELGNLLWGNSRGEYPVDRDLTDLFYEIFDIFNCDMYGYTSDNDPSINDRGGITTDKIIIRPYYWGDDEDEAVLPNFEYRCGDTYIAIDWYKYPLRDAYSNIPLTKDVLHGIIYTLKGE